MNRKALDEAIRHVEQWNAIGNAEAFNWLLRVLQSAKRDSDRLDFMLANGWALTAWAERFGAKRSGIDAAMAAEKKRGKRK